MAEENRAYCTGNETNLDALTPEEIEGATEIVYSDEYFGKSGGRPSLRAVRDELTNIFEHGF